MSIPIPSSSVFPPLESESVSQEYLQLNYPSRSEVTASVATKVSKAGDTVSGDITSSADLTVQDLTVNGTIIGSGAGNSYTLFPCHQQASTLATYNLLNNK